MGCTLNHVIIDLEACSENFSGTGSRVYFFLNPDLKNKPKMSEDGATFTADSFADLRGKLYAVDIKEQSSKVTSSLNANGGGFSNVLSFTVAKNMNDYAFDLRTLSLIKFGAFVADGKGGYYVLYSNFGSCTLENSADTGDTFDSDHGHTTTLTAAPMNYPLMRWCPVTTQQNPTTGETETVAVDLDSWLKEEVEPETNEEQDGE